MQEEFTLLKEQRKDAVEHLKKAREMGDLSETGYYKSSRAKLSSIDRRISELTYLLRVGRIRTAENTGIVQVGSSVILDHEGKKLHYQIVGAYEANPSEGRISEASPLGKVLIGKKAGDTVHFSAPAGVNTYKVLAVTAV